MKTVVRGAPAASLAAVELGTGGALVDMHSVLIGFS
jgi:hypothetical protein